MKEQTLTDYMLLVITGLEAENRQGTAHVYRSARRRVLAFAQSSPILFHQITASWLKSFQAYLLGDHLSWNTVSTYLRIVRAVYYRAVDNGFAVYVPRLFKKVYTGIRSDVKRAVPEECIRELSAHPVANKKTEEARLLFLLLFMLRGIPFVDIAFLRPCDLCGDRLTYHRRKTGTCITVRVEPAAMQLIEQLRDLRPDATYLFPLIREPGADEYRQYQNALRGINYRLDKLSALLPDCSRISTYSARHSWASIANYRQYDKELISNAMGHSSVRVTETYFKRHAQENIDRMNREILQGVCLGG